jgi:hypothetical protein
VERERSAAAAMLGLPGFVVLAASDNDGECEQAVETTAIWWAVRNVGRWPSCMIGVRRGARPACWRTAGDAGVGQAGVALPAFGVREANLD